MIFRILCFGILLSLVPLAHSQCSSNCTSTLTATGGSGNLTLNSGDTLCIRATTGNIDVNYDEIRFRPGAGINLCSDSEDTIKIHGELRFFSGTGYSEINNYGNTIITHTSGLAYVRNNVHNHGYFEVEGDFRQNTTAPRSFTNYEGSSLVVGGNIDVNAGAFDNYGTITGGGDLSFNGTQFSNSDAIEVAGEITLNASSTVYISNGIFIGDDLTLNSGNLETNNGCAAFLIKNNTIIFNGVDVVSGNVFITDSTDLDSWNTNTCADADQDCGGLVFTQNNTCFTALPVIFDDIYILDEGYSRILYWQISEELNNEKYIIKGSDDGVTFYDLGIVPSIGTFFVQHIYQYDITNFDASYYTIEQVDHDGFSSSSMVILSRTYDNLDIIYSNGILEILSSIDFTNFEIMNVNGNNIYRGTLEDNKADIGMLLEGVYVFKFSNSEQFEVFKRMID